MLHKSKIEIRLSQSSDKEQIHTILWVLKENLPSRKFYESLGGVLRDHEKEFIWKGKILTKEVCYLWKL